MTELLTVQDLVVEFPQRGWRAPPFRALDGAYLNVAVGEAVGLVGESGSGKSTLGRAVLGLVKVASGRILFQGEDVTHLASEKRDAAMHDMQVVFQDPYGSLNPARTIGTTIAEPLLARRRLTQEEVRAELQKLLTSVNLPADVADRYPFAFSGGQRQRIAIARALSTSPRLIVCDEALSALDVVTQGQILNLLLDLQSETGVALLFIAHSLTIVRHLSSSIVVLYRGRVMEAGPAASVYADPLHPYTRALLAAEPVIDPGQQRARREARHTLLKRDTTDEAALEGCPFAPRCPEAAAVCSTTRPREDDVDGRRVACHLYDPQSGHPGAVSISRGVRPSDSARGAHHAQAQGTITAKTHEMLGDSESLGNAFVWRGDR